MQETLIVNTEPTKLKLIKKFLKELDVKYTMSNDRLYNDAFNEKMKRSEKSFEEGSDTVVTLDEIWK